jgi:hypothetical protein
MKIRFDLKPNLTSSISDFSESQHLASYVSHHNTMAYDTVSISVTVTVLAAITINAAIVSPAAPCS